MDRVSDLGFREKEGRNKYGNHRMRVDVPGGTASGLVGRKDMIMDETVNRWHTAESDVGTVEFTEAGIKTLRLSLESCDSSAEQGPTVCGIRLVRST
jgi:hypothetical protein